MNLHLTKEELSFRDEVRAFLMAELDPALAERQRLHLAPTKAEMEDWHARLNARGWLGGNWPREFGGAGWNPIQRHIFEEETARAHAPRIVPFGVTMLGPVLQKFGNKAQQDHWLPRILNGQDWWCQGYSEPGAGSDLASLRTRAERDGDHYVVNGHKTWTTMAQHANMIFCLVRTSDRGRPQEGISFLLIDLTSPGVTVRPIVLIDGSVEVNEVYFDNVRVPAENLVGEENKGWDYAKYLLTHERTNLAGIGFAWADLDNLKRVATMMQQDGRPLTENPLFAPRVAEIEIDLMALATTNMRMLAAARDGAAPGVQASMLKVKGTEIRQRIHALTRKAFGPWAMAYATPVDLESSEAPKPPSALAEATAATRCYINNRKLSIYGGSNEIQRNIIAAALLKE